MLVGDGLVVVETLGGGIVGEAPRGRAILLHRRPPALLGGNGGGKQQKVKEAQKFLEKHDPQHQQWKEEARRRRGQELQEQAEVLAKVMKEQF